MLFRSLFSKNESSTALGLSAAMGIRVPESGAGGAGCPRGSGGRCHMSGDRIDRQAQRENKPRLVHSVWTFR